MKHADYSICIIRYCRTIFLSAVLLTFSLNAFSQLSGTYTIGPAMDYENFTEAANALSIHGVDGPAIFNVVSGTYTEQPEFNNIAGVTESNTVTFQSLSGDSTSVILQYDGTEYADNYVVLINGADFITFKNLTFKALGDDSYGKVIEMIGYSHDITFSNNEFIGIVASDASAARIIFQATTPASSSYYNISIKNNKFYKGGYAIHLQGPNDTYLIGTHISGNTFIETGYASIYCNYNYAPVITYNTIDAGSYGIRVNGDYGEGICSFNHVNSGRTGIEYHRFGFSGNKAIISNNLVSIGENGTYGISIVNSTKIDVIYNSVYVNSKSVVSAAFYSAYGVDNVSSVDVLNNNFANENGGYAINVHTPGVIGNMDHNNLYTAGNYIAKWENENIFDLYDLQSVSGLNDASLNVYPHYISEDDPHTTAPWLDNTGIPIGGIDVDFDGEARHAETPDIGADEFTADPLTITPLSGTYTIGLGGNYPTISSAFEDALIKGASTDITFALLNGTYNEQLVLRSIPGTGKDRRVTLTSQSGNPEDVIISYSSDDYYVNWIMQLHGLDFITIQNLTIKADGSTYSRVIDFWQGADSIQIVGNILEGSVSSGNQPNSAVFYSGDSDFRSRRIENNIIRKGSYAIYMRRDQNNYQFPTGAEIKDNTFIETGYAGIYLQFYNAPIILGNYFEASYSGIKALSCSNDLIISKNEIQIKYDEGIQLSTCYGTEEKKGLVSNNFISSVSSSTIEGININSSSNQLILNNSVLINSTSVSTKAFYISSGGTSSITIHNNIFANKGSGYSFYIANPVTVVGSDYNDLYAAEGMLAFWGADMETLDALKTASGMEEHSISANPQFVSDTDLHTMAEALDGAGASLAAVPDDIDGEPRNLVTPDIGADEFNFVPNNPPVVEKPIPDLVIYQENSITDIALLDTVFVDPDVGDQLTYTAACLNVDITAQIEIGVLKLSTTPGYIGSGEVLVKATDMSGDYVRDTFIVEYVPVPNTPPVAVDDTITTAIEITINPLINDYDDDGDALTILEISTPNQGNASILPGETSILYSPLQFNPQYDTIRYIIGDGNGATDTAHIYITLYILMTGFTEMEYSLTNISHGTAKWGDYDNDKDLDILLTGWIGTNQDYITQIHEYDNGTYSDIGASILRELSSGNPEGASWCDYNNDGVLDIIISGRLSNAVTNKYTSVYSNHETFFSEESADAYLTGLSSASTDWGDYNNDGRIDLLVSGMNENGTHVTEIYRNHGPGPFGGSWALSNPGITLPGAWDGDASWVDIESDGDLDIFICGNGTGGSLLYINDMGTFTQISTEIGEFIYAASDWGDFDNDGDPDLAISGRYGGEYTTQIYQNKGKKDASTWNFSALDANFKGMESGDLAWGDYDNDGDLDLITTGNTSLTGSKTILYTNSEGIFADSHNYFPSFGRSSVEWGDYDNDGDLDLLMTGYSPSEMGQRSLVFKNDLNIVNTPPSSPGYLAADIYADHILLTWNASVDGETPVDGLSYNIRIGTTEGGDEVMNAMAHTDGVRKLAGIGNAGQKLDYWLNQLPAGMYYWSVQAIDHGFSGSAFAEAQTINIVGLNEKEAEDNIRIYPVPAHDKLYVDCDDKLLLKKAKILIVDGMGRTVLADERFVKQSSEFIAIDVAQISAGSYFLVIMNENSVIRKSFIKF